MEEFHRLSDCFRAVLNSNEELRIGLKAEDDEAELSEQQKEDLENSVKEVETKLAETKDIVQKNLWSKYGRNELGRSILYEEGWQEEAESVAVDSNNLKGYEVYLTVWYKDLMRPSQP